MNRTYISGGMSKYTREEYTRRFGIAEKHLKEQGRKTFNPTHWVWFLKYLPYRFALAFDIFMLCFCDRIYMLEDWTESDGARAEHAMAASVGIIIEYER